MQVAPPLRDHLGNVVKLVEHVTERVAEFISDITVTITESER